MRWLEYNELVSVSETAAVLEQAGMLEQLLIFEMDLVIELVSALRGWLMFMRWPHCSRWVGNESALMGPQRGGWSWEMCLLADVRR